MRRRVRELIKIKAAVLTQSRESQQGAEKRSPHQASALHSGSGEPQKKEEERDPLLDGQSPGSTDANTFQKTWQPASLEMLLKKTVQWLVVLSFIHHCLIFFSLNTKVNNTGEGAPRSVHTDVYSDFIPQTTALSGLQVEE